MIGLVNEAVVTDGLSKHLPGIPTGGPMEFLGLSILLDIPTGRMLILPDRERVLLVIFQRLFKVWQEVIKI